MKISTFQTALIALINIVPVVVAHTWIDQLRNINDKGQYVGDAGYPRRKYVQGEEGYNMNSSVAASGVLHLLPTIEEKGQPFISEETMLCHPYQRKQKQTSNYPRLETVPGQFVALRYLENGHVTIVGEPPNDQKERNNGTVFVYGTTQPKEDEKLVNVLQWTKDGKGGNKGGVLLAAQNYDDGRCHQNNDRKLSQERASEFPNYAMGQAREGSSNLELPCESDVQIPKDAATGKPYTLYWVWQWNSLPGTPGLPDGKSEYYTTCMDVDIVDKVNEKAKLKHPMFQQDGMPSAVPDFKSRKAMYTDPIKAEPGPYFSKKGIQYGDSGSGGNATAPTATGAPSAKPTRKPTGSPKTTLATVTSSATGGSKPTSPAANDGIPTITKRPGRPQPSKAPDAAAPGSGNKEVDNGNDSDSGNVVTVTDIIKVTVTAPAATATITVAPRALTNGAKFRVAGPLN